MAWPWDWDFRKAEGGPMRRIPLLWFVCLVSVCQENTPTFRSGTTLIEFTVVAVGRNGNPVTDLKKEEITIAEEGKARDVAFFRFEGGAETAKPEPLPPGVFTN